MLGVVDRLDITILVDNVTDNLSSVPSFVETELSSHWKRGMRLLSGKCLCCAAHGLSCLITAHAKGSAHTLLFDTGPGNGCLSATSLASARTLKWLTRCCSHMATGTTPEPCLGRSR